MGNCFYPNSCVDPSPFLFLWQLILSSWEGGYNLQCQDLASAGEADVRVSHEEQLATCNLFLLKRTEGSLLVAMRMGAGVDEKGTPVLLEMFGSKNAFQMASRGRQTEHIVLCPRNGPLSSWSEGVSAGLQNLLQGMAT